MANFDSLPPEIISQVLQHIDSTKQLGECRRVCKRWDNPAECAMFSRKLYITRYNPSSLYMHLSRKPSRVSLIKEIYLGAVHFTDIMALLLRLGATPSLREIASDVYPNIRFYETLAQITKDSGMKLQHLKSIPWPTTTFTETHYQAALLLKDSLEEIKILPSSNSNGPHEISKHLEEFKCLSTLRVTCIFQNLPQVESIFRGARKLKKIDLRKCYINQENNWSSQERLHWMKQYVEINEAAMTLQGFGQFNLSVPFIEYFLYKYPNMREFDYVAVPVGSVDPNVEISTQACLWISKIPNYTMTLTYLHQWKTHYRSFAGYKNTSELWYYQGEMPELRGINSISSKMEHNQKRNTRFQFMVGSVFEEELFDPHATFLEDIGAFTTSLYMNFEDPDIYGIDHRHTFQSKALFQALKVMNHLDDMQFISPGRLEAVELNLSSQHQKRRLKTLEITGREFQPGAFHTLDRLFHAINTLKLSYCYIKKDRTNTLCIHMPSTALEKLSISTELEPSKLIPSFDFFGYQSGNQGKILLSHDTFIMLNLQQGVTLYFKLEPFNSNIQQIPFVDYVGRPRDSTAFSIYTRLIASIELDLDDICAKIDVQKYCKTLDAAFDELQVND